MDFLTKMEDDRAGESDSDFASAESDQDHEELKITDSNSSPIADDVATPMTSSLKDEDESRDKGMVASAVQTTDDDAKELTGSTSQPEQDEKPQPTDVQENNSQNDSQHNTPPVASTEQTIVQEHATNENTLNTDSSVTSHPRTTSASTSVAHDVREAEDAKQSQDKVCMMCEHPCVYMCVQACVGTSCVA